MRQYLRSYLLMVAFLFTAGSFFIGCEGGDKVTGAEIFIIDDEGRKISGAWVKLFCDGPDCIVTDSQQSNSQGFSYHEFDNPAVLRINVRHTALVDSIDGTTIYKIEKNFFGEGFVTLDEESTVQETVIIYPID